MGESCGEVELLGEGGGYVGHVVERTQVVETVVTEWRVVVGGS